QARRLESHRSVDPAPQGGTHRPHGRGALRRTAARLVRGLGAHRGRAVAAAPAARARGAGRTAHGARAVRGSHARGPRRGGRGTIAGKWPRHPHADPYRGGQPLRGHRGVRPLPPTLGWRARSGADRSARVAAARFPPWATTGTLHHVRPLSRNGPATAALYGGGRVAPDECRRTGGGTGVGGRGVG